MLDANNDHFGASPGDEATDAINEDALIGADAKLPLNAEMKAHFQDSERSISRLRRTDAAARLPAGAMTGVEPGTNAEAPPSRRPRRSILANEGEVDLGGGWCSGFPASSEKRFALVPPQLTSSPLRAPMGALDVVSAPAHALCERNAQRV